MLDRRSFMQSAAGFAALFPFVSPEMLKAELLKAADTPTQLPDRSLYDKDEEAYWTAVRKTFLIPEGMVYLNNGTVGSSHMPVPSLPRVSGRQRASITPLSPLRARTDSRSQKGDRRQGRTYCRRVRAISQVQKQRTRDPERQRVPCSIQ